jgi:phage gp36-like protein
MAFLTKADFATHIYAEIIDEITRNNDTIVTKAINNAVSEMKAYLNRYDFVLLFGDASAFSDEYLKSIGKDIACWHLLKLVNPNINLELFRTAYEDAIKFLKLVMKGEADPAWPLKADDPNTPNDDAGLVEYRSLPKRTNHF